MQKKISIIIPAYNEELTIPELTKRLTSVIDTLPYNFEIIIVENGSTDNTLPLLLNARKKDKRFKILQLSKNVGCDGGIISGLHYARGDAAIIMMADLQEPPQLITKLLEKWEKGYEIVYGIVIKRENASITRKLATYVFYKIIRTVSKGLVPENASDFRLIDKDVYEVINSMKEHNKFFRGLVTWTGFRQTGIPFKRSPRYAGKSKAYFSTVFKVAMDGIMSYSNISYQIPWFLAVICIGIGCLFLLFKNIPFSLACFMFTSIFLLFGIQFDYTRRIMDEVRGRPEFIIKSKYGL